MLKGQNPIPPNQNLENITLQLLLRHYSNPLIVLRLPVVGVNPLVNIPAKQVKLVEVKFLIAEKLLENILQKTSFIMSPVEGDC